MANSTLKFVPVLGNNLENIPFAEGQFIISPESKSISIDYGGSRKTISQTSLFNTLSFLDENTGETEIFTGSEDKTITIPKTLKNVTMEIVTEENTPYAGATVGEQYIKFVVGNGINAQKTYISLKGILDERLARVAADNEIKYEISSAVKTIGTSLNTITSDISGIETSISDISYTISSMDSRLTDDISTIQGDIGTLKLDTSRIDLSISGITGQIGGIISDISSLNLSKQDKIADFQLTGSEFWTLYNGGNIIIASSDARYPLVAKDILRFSRSDLASWQIIANRELNGKGTIGYTFNDYDPTTETVTDYFIVFIPGNNQYVVSLLKKDLNDDNITVGNGLTREGDVISIDESALPKSWIEVYDESGVEDILTEGNLGEYVKYCGETTENYEYGRLYRVASKPKGFEVGKTYNRIYFNTNMTPIEWADSFMSIYESDDMPRYDISEMLSAAILIDTLSERDNFNIDDMNNSDNAMVSAVECMDYSAYGMGKLTFLAFFTPNDGSSNNVFFLVASGNSDSADNGIMLAQRSDTNIHVYINGEEDNNNNDIVLPDYLEFDIPFIPGKVCSLFSNLLGPEPFESSSNSIGEILLQPIYINETDLKNIVYKKISTQIEKDKEIFSIKASNAEDILIEKNIGKYAKWDDDYYNSSHSGGLYSDLNYGQLYLIVPKESTNSSSSKIYYSFSNKIYFHNSLRSYDDFTYTLYDYLEEYFESATKLVDNNSSLETSLAFSGTYNASQWNISNMSISELEENMFRYGGCTISKYSNDSSRYPYFYITLYPDLESSYDSLENTNYSKERFIIKFTRNNNGSFAWVCEDRNDKERDEIDRSITFSYNTCSGNSPINWVSENSEFMPNSYTYRWFDSDFYLTIKDDNRYIQTNYEDINATKVLRNIFSRNKEYLEKTFNAKTDGLLAEIYITNDKLENEIYKLNETINQYSMWYDRTKYIDDLPIGSHVKNNTELSVVSEGVNYINIYGKESDTFYFNSLSNFYIDEAFGKLETFRITEGGNTWVYCILMNDTSGISEYNIECLEDAERMYKSAFLVSKYREGTSTYHCTTRLNGPDGSYIEEGYSNITINYGNDPENPAILYVYRRDYNQNISELTPSSGITTLSTNNYYICGVKFRDSRRIYYFNSGGYAFSQCFKNFVSIDGYPDDNNDTNQYEKFNNKISLTPIEVDSAIESKLARVRGSISNAAVINVRADTLLEPLTEGMVLKAGDKLHFDTSDTSAYDTILNNLSYSNGMAFLSSNDVGFGGLLAALDFSVPTNGAVTSKSLIMVTGQSLLDATFIYSTSAGSYGPLSWGAGFQNLDPLGDIELSESSNIISVHNETNWNGTLISVKHLVYDRTLKDDQFYKIKNSRNVPSIGSVVSLDNLYLDKANIQNYLSSLEYWNASISPFNMGNYVAPIIMLQSAVSGYTNRNIPPEKVLLGAVRDNGTYKLKLMSEWGFPTNTIYDSSKKGVSPYDSDGWYMTADKYCKNLLNNLIQKVPELTNSTWVYTGGSRYNNYYSLVFTFDEGKLFKNTILGKEDDVILQSKLDETVDGINFSIKNKKYNEIKDAPITRKSVLDIANPSEYFINNGQTFPDSSTVNPSDIKINKKKKPIFTSTDTKDWYRNGSSSVWCKNLAALMDENSGVTYYLALGYYPYNGRDYTYVMIDTTNFETTAPSFSSWSMIRTSLYNPGLEGTVGWLADDLGEYFSSKGITTDLDLLVLDQDLFDKFFVSEIGDERLYRTAADISVSYKVLDTADVVSVVDQSSVAPISSAAVYTVMSGKQDTLTWDVVPTESSDNPVTSDGIYSAIQDVREVASGKTASYVITSKTDITGTENSNGKGFTAVTDISGLNIANLKVGDNIYLIDTDVPDYWVSDVSTTNDIVTSISLNILETAKIDICDDYTQIDANSTKLFTGRAIYQALNALKTALTPVSSSIAFNSWISDATIDPYKYKSSAVITCGSNATIRLINDQPVAFANYGFVIGSVTPLTSTTATVTVYAVDDPSSATLTISVLEG